MRYGSALITGASSGIGQALARRLAANGLHVVLCARRETALRNLAEEITALGGKATVRVLDVSDSQAVVSTIQELDDEIEGLDIVIANAGAGGRIDVAIDNWDSILRMVRVNFEGAMATLTAILPRMIERNRGHLVAISSLGAVAHLPYGATYSATKAGLTMFMRALRTDLLGTGVAVTVVHPGFVNIGRVKLFPMPFSVDVDAAAKLIWKRLQAAPAEINFPLKYSILYRLLRYMPIFLSDRLYSQLRKKLKPPPRIPPITTTSQSPATSPPPTRNAEE